MKTITTSKALIALVLAIAMAIGLVGCGNTAGPPATVTDPETGTVTEIPAPDANSGINWGGWGNTGGKDKGDKNKDDKDTSKADGHVPGTPRDSKPYKSNQLKSYGDLVTLVKSVKTPSKYDGQTSSNDTNYGKVDWSTANQGYVTFTAKGQIREFILESPNGKQELFTVPKGDTAKASLIDGIGKYQYAIANLTSNGKSYTVQYKNSFEVKKIDSDLAPYLVSTPYGDYENAPNAVAKADELWDTSKTQLANVKEIAHYVYGTLHYDKTLKVGTLDVYVNPDKIIENGGGVCNEMSKTLVAMLRSQGIPAYMQNGKNSKGQSHGWVMAWLELSSETKNGTTYSTGTWVLIEATGGGLQSKSVAEKNYTPGTYAG